MSFRVSGDESGRAADPAIKLFGRTIPLMEPGSDPVPDPIEESTADESKDLCKETSNTEVKDTGLDAARELEGEQNNSSSLNNTNEDESHTSSQDVMEKSDSKPEQNQSGSDDSVQEKVLKKPDKILPCPRCNSLDTKFCYYNNYNVNQPRHFCKNCQRYWTAGGTMRNVPVGAGRRRTKSSAAQYHLMGEGVDSNHHQTLSINGNGTVLKFGSEAQHCDSMSSALDLDEKKRTELSTGEPSCASTVTASDCVENGSVENAVHTVQNGMHGYCNGFTPVHPLQYYPGPPWVYPIFPAPAFCTPTIPVPFVPPAFWPTRAWTVPWVGSNDSLFPSQPSSNNGCSVNGSPNLGKHSRDASLQGEDQSEKSLWVPKTLRIDDPNEAAMSSIWATLGIKPDKGSMFKAFPCKFESKGNKPDTPQALHANPAAFSRSQSFQEST